VLPPIVAVCMLWENYLSCPEAKKIKKMRKSFIFARNPSEIP